MLQNPLEDQKFLKGRKGYVKNKPEQNSPRMEFIWLCLRDLSQRLILNFILKIFPSFPSSFHNFSFALSPSPALQKQRKKKNPKTHSGDLSLLSFL